MQVDGSLVLEDNSKVGEGVLEICSISMSAKEENLQLTMASSGREFGYFPFLLVEWGVAGSFSGRINCEGTKKGRGIPVHDFLAQP